MEINQHEDVANKMPESIRRIKERGGVSSVKLVMEKKLFKTDVSLKQCCLSMPKSQVDDSFLTEGEKETLDRKVGGKCQGLEVDFNEPSNTVKDIALRKNHLRTNFRYVLAKKWSQVIKKNALQEYDLIQVWSYREEDKLKLALIILRRAGEN